MNKIIRNLFFLTLDRILDFRQNVTIQQSPKLDYSSLAPISDGDEAGHYSKALKWALKNRKSQDIKNIALTGPYGSGKSTILKTFQKHHAGKDLKFLNISLATFKEEKIKRDEKGNVIFKEKEDRLRLIETSILQQIFYHEEDKDIPDSRFKKIKSYSKKSIGIIAVGTLLFLLALLNYFYPAFNLQNFYFYSFSQFELNILQTGSVVIIFLGLFLIIFKSVRIISSLTINKLKFQNAEIEITKGPNNSILNHHLDEILYFFTVTPYNVVIIEDLDRFQETEIFTKLREINLLLNNSKKTKEKNIVFIYAVRDDMFSDNERIKFFDFIVPVIPVINSSNSSELLLRKNKQNGYNLSESFIENLAFFIDDMRLLHNVTNEFYLYKQKHGETPLNEEKLFAIVTYKNIYPNDFVKLSKNDGDLFNIFNSKSALMKGEIDIINKQISEIKKRIEGIEQLHIKNLKELRLLYIGRVLESTQKLNIHSFKIKDITKTVDELLEDDNFISIQNDELEYQTQEPGRYGRMETFTRGVPINFEDIEKRVDDKKRYNQREEEILNFKSNKTLSLKQKIQELEKEKVKKRNSKIADLINLGYELNLDLSPEIDADFIMILIRNGYIAEDYLDYISLFHGESITRSDHKFIISLKNRQKLEFDYRLSKIEKIIPKINIMDFGSDYILNYDLLDYLLKRSENYADHLNLIFLTLKNESQFSIEFIEGFLEKSENLEVFIRFLTKHWTNIWSHFVNELKYPDDKVRTTLKYIIEYSELSSIKLIEKNSNLKDYILNDPNFLLISSNHKRLIKVIQELQLRFKDLNLNDSPPTIVDFIFNKNFYAFDTAIIVSLLKKYGEFNQRSFFSANYSFIKESGLTPLILYVEENINEFIESFYLKEDSAKNEDKKHLTELLNNKDLFIENKKILINKNKTKIFDLESIHNKELQDLLLENFKVEPRWANLLTVYKAGESLPDHIISYLNVLEHSKTLAETKIPKEDEKQNYSAFTRELLETNEIMNESYNFVTKSIPWWYQDLKIEKLSEEKVLILIKNLVIQPTAESFSNLKTHHENLNIKLLEKHKTRFFEFLDEVKFDGKDLEMILKSKDLNHLEKNRILKGCTNEVISSNLQNLELINNLILENSNFEVNEFILRTVLLSNQISKISRIKLFNMNLCSIDESFIKKFLTSLGKDYERIIHKNRKAKIEDNVQNHLLLQKLKDENFISSYSKRLFGLQVNHKRK